MSKKKLNIIKIIKISEFFEIAKDLPDSFNNNSEYIQNNDEINNNNIEILGSHFLVPQSSFSLAVIYYY